MTERSASHTSFVIERDFPAPPSHVFFAWSDVEAKLSWSDCHTDARDSEFSMDFRHGGHEHYRVRLPDGMTLSVEKVFFDIVPDQRIIFGYDLVIGEKRLSASLVTVSFEPSRKGTHMTYTEQLALLDGFTDVEERIEGTNEGFDRLELLLRDAVRA
ncbi:SRPBCC family protein [Steroidobacter sp. S1-65]|uniref:SRPBCC family protein n=1 Tax=Steroidobacter gossypii TaxID=2805490 RepID=A0ABS1WZR9_9GAMM|nr:SRPBCC family protein [Steroidobacter gossypii]MBM0106442.1 SRPBCC family protein [Steroidobacter gossypii]